MTRRAASRALVVALSLIAGNTNSMRALQALTDSVPRDSTRWKAGGYRGPHGMGVALYGAVFAPPWITSLLPATPADTPSRLGFWRNHLSIGLTVGPGGTQQGHWPEVTDAGSVNAEMLYRGVLVEMRAEHFRVPEYLLYRTIRVGRLTHPAPMIAAGFTVGYREVRGPRPHDGFELALPLIAGGRTSWWRLETSYVASEKQSSWNYRLQWERLVGRGPFFMGANMELKSWEIRNRGELSHGALGVLFGTAYRGRSH